MTDVSAAGQPPGAGTRAGFAVSSRARRRELAAMLALGAAGAGLVLVALRQEWAKVTVLAPRPLPASVVVVTGQALIPAAAGIAVAALASLAAVLATRRLLRRATGLISMALGAWVAALAAGQVSAEGVLAAARRAAPVIGSGAGTAAGSVTAGGGPSGTGGIDAGTGFPAHVLLTASGWRGLVIAGALLVIAAGLAVTLMANRLPVMSGRYDRPARPARGDNTPAGRPDLVGRPADAAGLWDSLSAGADPTAGPGSDIG